MSSKKLPIIIQQANVTNTDILALATHLAIYGINTNAYIIYVPWNNAQLLRKALRVILDTSNAGRRIKRVKKHYARSHHQ